MHIPQCMHPFYHCWSFGAMTDAARNSLERTKGAKEGGRMKRERKDGWERGGMRRERKKEKLRLTVIHPKKSRDPALPKSKWLQSLCSFHATEMFS